PMLVVPGLDADDPHDPPDALLVPTRARAQQVKDAVDALRARGRDDLL
ncbi:MAG: mannose-1-phosphate guanylyltransferase, partial [Cellulomonas sp.]|nr:mannose-1-phosphate guanylyltransferase [Cellulomonas sp.]